MESKLESAKYFEDIIKIAIKNECNFIKMENESSGFEIYLILGNSGFAINKKEIKLGEIRNFLKKVKKNKGLFLYEIDNVKYEFSVKFRRDFGEEVFSLKFKETS